MAALVVLACVAALCFAASDASASVVDPISPSNWSSAESCPLLTLIEGGCAPEPGDLQPDGVTVKGAWATTETEVELGSKVVPAFETVPGLQSIALAATAFAVGWHIGSTLNNRWLHINGAGLGLAGGTSGGYYLVAMSWFYHAAQQIAGGAYTLPPGWYPSSTQYVRNGVNSGGYSAFYGDQTDAPLATWFATLNASAATTITIGVQCFASSSLSGSNVSVYGGGSCPAGDPYQGQNWKTFYIPQANAAAALTIDQQAPYTSQSSGISTGWANPATGAGVTTAAPAFNSGEATPCVTTSGGQVCSASAPADITNLNGMPADPSFTDPGVNNIRHHISPSTFTAPTYSADGGAYVDPGGPAVTTFTMPDIQEWELPATYTTALPDDVIVTTTALPETQGDPSLGPGEVVSTDPDPGTVVQNDPSAPPRVTIWINPDDYPYPNGDTNNPAPGSNDVSGQCNGPIPLPGIDLTPLQGHALMTKFPLGVFTWAQNTLSAWTGSGAAPSFDLPINYPSGSSSHEMHVDLSVLDPAMPVIKNTFLIASTILLWWSLMTSLIGYAAGNEQLQLF